MMRSDIFWTVTCLLVVLATVLFGSWLPAAPATRKAAAKPGDPSSTVKTIVSRVRPKPVIKIGSAVYVLVRIGKPYLYELRQPLSTLNHPKVNKSKSKVDP